VQLYISIQEEESGGEIEGGGSDYEYIASHFGARLVQDRGTSRQSEHDDRVGGKERKESSDGIQDVNAYR